MKGKILSWIVLILLLLLPVTLCCGIAFADDGAGAAGSDWSLLWLAVGAVAMTLLNLYWDVFKPKLLAVWVVKEDTLRWKLRGTLIAAGISLCDMLKAAYKRGLLDAIISIIIKIIRARLGIPTAVRKASAVFKR